MQKVWVNKKKAWNEGRKTVIGFVFFFICFCKPIENDNTSILLIALSF